MFKNFSDFVDFCNSIANELHTIVENHLYEDYNFGNVSFMTDHFGGTYCNFHYDLLTNEIVDWYGSSHAYMMTSKDEFFKYIKEKMEHELSVRDLNKINKFINSEY